MTNQYHCASQAARTVAHAPISSEIALVGKAPGQYSLFLGGDALGERLNQLAHENVNESEILQILDGHFAAFAKQRSPAQSFGDFVAEAI